MSFFDDKYFSIFLRGFYDTHRSQDSRRKVLLRRHRLAGRQRKEHRSDRQPSGHRCLRGGIDLPGGQSLPGVARVSEILNGNGLPFSIIFLCTCCTSVVVKSTVKYFFRLGNIRCVYF